MIISLPVEKVIVVMFNPFRGFGVIMRKNNEWIFEGVCSDNETLVNVCNALIDSFLNIFLMF